MGKLTLNTDMDVVLGLLGFSCIFIGFGEGVCVVLKSAYATERSRAIRRVRLPTRDRDTKSAR
jgi:hypothetical protein